MMAEVPPVLFRKGMLNSLKGFIEKRVFGPAPLVQSMRPGPSRRPETLTLALPWLCRRYESVATFLESFRAQSGSDPS